MRRWTARPATEEDAREVARRIRRKDRLEMIEWTAQDADWAVVESWRLADVAFALESGDGELLGIYGAKVDNVLEGTAVLWGLSTESVEKHKIDYVSASKPVLAMIMRALPDVVEFHNWVSNDYPQAQKWIEWMGGAFSMKGVREGFGGSVFREFYLPNEHGREKPCVW